MSHQINLFTPAARRAKARPFSAAMMLQALALLLLLGGGACAYWVWSLNIASAGFKRTLETQVRELEGLRADLLRAKAASAPPVGDATKELQRRRSEIAERENLLKELQRGVFRPGWGHSAQLQLLAQTTPPLAWLTAIKVNDALLEVSGLTLDPAVLSDWVLQLVSSPLLAGQNLATVKVEKINLAAAKAVPATPLPTALAQPQTVAMPAWSFHLLSAVPPKPVPVQSGSKTAATAKAGGNP